MKKSKKECFKKPAIMPTYKYFIAGIISIFMVMIPWISRLKIFQLDDKVAMIFPNDKGIYLGFFLYYKEIVTIVFAALVVLFFIGEKVFPDNVCRCPLQDSGYKSVIICAAVYSCMVLLSCIFSRYKELSLMGSPTECEGMFVLLSYMVMFLAGINYFCYEKSIQILKMALIILMSIILVLTCIEFFYKPIFEINLFQRLLVDSKYNDLIASLRNTKFRSMVSLTFYNPDYFGMMCAVMVPIMLSLFINEKSGILKVWLGVLSIGSILCTASSVATASMYVTFAEILAILLIFRKRLIKNYKSFLIYVMALICICIIINILSNGKAEGTLTSVLKNKTRGERSDRFEISNITLNDGVIEIDGEGDLLIIEGVNNGGKDTPEIYFYDKNRKRISYSINGNTYTLLQKPFENITVTNLSYGILIDAGYDDPIKFYITDDGFKGVGQDGCEISNISRDKVKLENLYHIASGRGYTWVNTISMLKHTMVWGYGPGSFAMYFQQNDYAGLLKTHGTTDLVIDKPHCIYLQTAVQTGVAGLVSLLVIFILVLKKSLKCYILNQDKLLIKEGPLGLGIFIGTLGFMVNGLVNDSIVTISPLFWILLGASCSIQSYVEGVNIGNCLYTIEKLKRK